MHPRVAARIGVKVIALLVVANALPSVAAFVAQVGNAVIVWLGGMPRSTFGQATGLRWVMWVWSAGPAALQLGFAALLYFRADRIAARIAPPSGGLCEDCGYDLRGVAGERCPECGAPATAAGRRPSSGQESSGAESARRETEQS